MATKKTIIHEDYPVLLAEVAARLGGMDPDALAARLDGEVGTDWAGRAVVTAATARRLVEEREREEAEREERRAEARARRAAWEREREAFIVETMTRISEDFRRRWAETAAEGYANPEQVRADLARLAPPPHVRAAVRDRLAEALRDWERKHPAPPRPEEVA